MTIPEIIFGAVKIWASIGALLAVIYLAIGIDRIDEDAQGAYAFRPLLIPACLLIWPLIIWRWFVLETGRDQWPKRHNPPLGSYLGKWRLQGEICDGKRIAGAMQPGRGLAHKACAILCLFGDIPPVFVSTQPIEGSEFLLVGAADGEPLPESTYDLIGQFVEVEANIERRGDMLVMLVDIQSMKLVE